MKFIFPIFFLSSSLISNAHPGVGIVEDSKGNIYYTDLKQVWKISTNGSKKVVVNNVHTHELYMDEQDNLYGEHLWYNGEQKNTWGYYVWRLSAEGKVEKVIPDTEGFLSDYSFVRDHLGRMYWADRSTECQAVVMQNPDHSSKKFADPCFENIRWMKATADGDVYVVDFQDLKKIGRDGKIITIASKIADKKMTKSSTENQNSVFGVWTDLQGNLYAAVYRNREVKKFSLQGKEETVLKTAFPWSPSGGLVDSLGNLWVLEGSITNAVRVERITKDGRRTAF